MEMMELVVQRGQEQESQLSRASGGRGIGNQIRAVKAERSEIQKFKPDSISQQVQQNLS